MRQTPDFYSGHAPNNQHRTFSSFSAYLGWDAEGESIRTARTVTCKHARKKRTYTNNTTNSLFFKPLYTNDVAIVQRLYKYQQRHYKGSSTDGYLTNLLVHLLINTQQMKALTQPPGYYCLMPVLYVDERYFL